MAADDARTEDRADDASHAPEVPPLTPGRPVSVISELGMLTTHDGQVLRGTAHAVAELCTPDTRVIRSSVLATWADVLSGLLSTTAISPRIPVTLDLELQRTRLTEAGPDILGVARVIKAGRSIVVCQIRFTEVGDERSIAIAHCSFMASPNPVHVQPSGGFLLDMPVRHRLSMPLAERLGLEVLAPGVAEIPRRPDSLNSSGSLQGGLVSVVAEEAAVSAATAASANGAGHAVANGLSIRYLRPFRVGPAHAIAELSGDIATVEITDAGQGKLCAVATVRVTPLDHGSDRAPRADT